MDYQADLGKLYALELARFKRVHIDVNLFWVLLEVGPRLRVEQVGGHVRMKAPLGNCSAQPSF